MAPDEILLAVALRGSSRPDWSEAMHLKSRHLSPKQRRALAKAALARFDLPPELHPIATAMLKKETDRALARQAVRARDRARRKRAARGKKTAAQGHAQEVRPVARAWYDLSANCRPAGDPGGPSGGVGPGRP